MKKATIFIVIFLMLATTAYAETSSTGKIISIIGDIRVPGRSFCVKLSPAIPIGGGMACLRISNTVDSPYQELYSLILSAYMAGKTCEFQHAPAEATFGNEIKAVICP